MSDTLSDPLLGLLRDQQMLDDLQLEEVSEALNRGAQNAIAAIKDLGFMDAETCLLYTSPSPRDQRGSRMPSSA